MHRSTVLALLFVSLVSFADAQDTTRVDGEEFDIMLTVQRQGSTVIPSVLVENDVYLPVFEIFRFLRIKSLVSVSGDTLTGFFLSEDKPYTIDFAEQRIVIGEKEYVLKRRDFVRTEMSVFLRRALFGELFGLQCSFDMRRLLVDLQTELSLPLIREMERERIRRNVQRLTADPVADVVLHTPRPLLRPGMLDWNLAYSVAPERRSSWEAGLAAGIGLLGGDADIRSRISGDDRAVAGNLRWQWRFVDNDNTLLRQISLGRMTTLDRGNTRQAMLGLSLSNRPTTFRRSFGTYTLDGHTGPGWTVELYLHQVIIDVTTADASGYYQFEVPLSYGTTSLTLRFFGPWGEERTEERVVSLPFTFLRPGEIEYTLTGGRIESDDGLYMGRGEMNIGTGRHVTLGLGSDVVTADQGNRFSPFARTTVRPFDGLLFSGEYVHDAHVEALASVALPGRTLLDLSWRKEEATGTVSGSGKETRQFSLTSPITTSFLRGNIRALLRQELIAEDAQFSAEAVYSGSIFGIRSNVTLTGDRLSDAFRTLFLSYSVSLYLPLQSTVRPQLVTDVMTPELLTAGIVIERPLGNSGWITASLQRELAEQSWNASLALRWEMPFAQTVSGLTYRDDTPALDLAVQGTLGWDVDDARLHLDPKSWVRRGALTIETYLDLNNNGMRDEDEERLRGLDVKVNGGRVLRDDDGALIHVVDLESYRNYYVELSAMLFENISWQLAHASYEVTVYPNQFTMLSVPVIVAGEISGRVRTDTTLERSSYRGFQVQFVNAEGQIVAQTLTDRRGEYYHLGLLPADYTVRIDPQQLQRLGLEATTAKVTIRSLEEGDIIDGVELVLTNAR